MSALVFLGKTPVWRSALCVKRPPASSITKWAARISRKWFDLQSPNFTRTYTPAYSAATQAITWPTILLVGSYLEKTVEYAASDCFKSNVSGAAFCLPHQLVIGGLLVVFCIGPESQRIQDTASLDTAGLLGLCAKLSTNHWRYLLIGIGSPGKSWVVTKNSRLWVICEPIDSNVVVK